MKSLFKDNRMANMLQLFRSNPAITVSNMASKLEVSERTVRNDIKKLNQEMAKCAVIEGTQGKYRLHVFDADVFHQKCVELMESDDFLNSSRNRMDYVFGKLMRSDSPLLTDELAYEMNIGRTTIVNDIKKLRSEIEPYKLKIIGKTSKGLLLQGQERDIRRYVIDRNYDQIYREYPLDVEIEQIIDKAFSRYSWENNTWDLFKKYVTLMLDRFLTGHGIGELPSEYYNLMSYRAYQDIDVLIDDIGKNLRVTFPVEEKLFTLMPIIGMRTPMDIRNLGPIPLDETSREAAEKILQEIEQEMDITIESGDLTEEFIYHLMFMMNRLRFGVHLKNPILDDLREKYPLAYQMAGIASRVIEEEYHLTVTSDEQGYLAAYLSVFLAENDTKQEDIFRIAVVCGSGRVTARMIEMQLRKVLDKSVEIDLFSSETITRDILGRYSVVLTTVSLPCYCGRPMIRINEIFDAEELAGKIEKVRYWNQIDAPVLDNNWFVMASLLDESRFFRLDAGMTYEEAIDHMVTQLIDDWQLDEGFLHRLQEREQKGTMVFDHSVAIPHSVQYSKDKIVLAIGCCAQPILYHDHEIRVIFLIGLPEKLDTDDGILLRVYDEIISIARDSEMLGKIANADCYQTLLRIMYR